MFVCLCVCVGSGGREGVGEDGQGECEVGRRGSGREASPDRNHVCKVKLGEWTGLERIQRCVCDVRTYRYVQVCVMSRVGPWKLVAGDDATASCGEVVRFHCGQ